MAKRTPITVETSKGTVTLRHLTFTGLRSMEGFDKQALSDTEFMVGSLHLHLVEPAVPLAEFAQWPNADLEIIARAWAADSRAFDEPLSGTDVARAFRTAYRAAPTKWAESFKDIAKNAVETFRQQQEEFRQQMLRVLPSVQDFQHQIAEMLRPLLQGLKELPTQIRHAHQKLAQHGWYMDPDLPFPALWQLADLIADGKENDANNILLTHYRSQADNIEQRLTAEFPHRARIIAAAFRAHRSNEYELSIPVFLTQCDGLAFEFFGRQLFKKRAGLPELHVELQALAVDSIQATFLHPLAIPAPISASAHERGPGFRALNRHQVLHGEVTDYASEENSLKAISLLNWVAWAGPEFRKGNAA